MSEIIIKNKKLQKIGNSYFLLIPTAFVCKEYIDPDKEQDFKVQTINN